jgi:glycosyltransferase involved in cell wall biosynthesis
LRPFWPFVSRHHSNRTEQATPQPKPYMTNPTRPHEIAFVITELEVGGAERCLTNLVLRIDKKRFHPTVFVLAPTPARRDLIDQLNEAGIATHFFGATTIAQSWSVLKSLAKRLQHLAPDLVQTFMFHANVLGSRAARRARVPHIVHGMRVADPSKWRKRIEKVCARDVDRVVCVSASVADYLQHAGYDPEQLTVIPNGIDIRQYATGTSRHSLTLPIDFNRRKMVVVSRLHEQKGINWLLKVLPDVFEQFLDADLLLVGTGPAEAHLKSICQQLGLTSRVHFLGWRGDVPDILQASDLFLLPSRWEGMSNALLEAMASGLPVVSTRAEGSLELLGPLADQQSVAYGDSDALLNRISNILRSPQQAKELGDLNRRRSELFSLDRMVSSYENLYAEILAGR